LISNRENKDNSPNPEPKSPKPQEKLAQEKSLLTPEATNDEKLTETDTTANSEQTRHKKNYLIGSKKSPQC